MRFRRWVVLILFTHCSIVWAHEWKTETDTVFLPNQTELHLQIQKPEFKTKNPPKLPLVLIFGGFQDAAKILQLFQTSYPLLVATFDYPFDGSRKFSFPGSLFLISDAKKMILDTLDGIALAKNILRKRNDVDPNRIILIGASVGAPFALTAAARDPDWNGLALIHGFGQAPSVIAHQLNRLWSAKLGNWIEPLNQGAGSLLWWYSGLPALEDSAQTLRSHQKVLMISAETDSFIPKTASDSLWTALQKSKAETTQLITPGDHVQPGAQALLNQLISSTLDWMQKSKLLSL